MSKKKPEQPVEKDPRYHDTWKLLQKYRDVVWSLELCADLLEQFFPDE